VFLNRIVRKTGAMDFSEIYDRYARDVHRFSLYLSGNYALAEDLTAETFVRALCAPADLHVDTVQAYLLANARNLHSDFVSHNRRLTPISEATEDTNPAPLARARCRRPPVVDGGA
jgi:DNA-directed RNA polymerase specialized sigma24 family protein